CAAAREEIDRVDWECEVRRHYAESNLGIKRRVVSGLEWVFSQTDEAIILEDDCVPDPSFFRFCDEMLARFRYDARVLSVSGDTVQFGQTRAMASYYFSRYPHLWGWATWRRAWRLYDPDLVDWPRLRDSGWLEALLGDRRAVEYWSYLFDRAQHAEDIWDYAM